MVKYVIKMRNETLKSFHALKKGGKDSFKIKDQVMCSGQWTRSTVY